MTPKQTTLPLLDRMREFINRYVKFYGDDYSLVASLYIVATYLWDWMDAFPYLVITSQTKRSGKTRFSELIAFMSRNARRMTAVTPAVIYRSIEDEHPVLLFDEAENMSGESASTMRSLLNAGYRRGQKVARTSKEGIEEFETYCPKVFILIGDMFDTVRDRAILFRMRRAGIDELPARFNYSIVEAEGQVLADEIADWTKEHMKELKDAYLNFPGLPFLTDRDEEIWTPLFVVCGLLAPDKIVELQRMAADMCAEKSEEAQKYLELKKEAEDAASTEEYTERLLVDLLSIFKEDDTTNHNSNRNSAFISTADAITRLHDIPTAPWRRFRGPGLGEMDLSKMLRNLNVKPGLIRKGSSKSATSKVFRGYRRADIERALKLLKGGA